MRPELSPRQKETLEWVKQFISQHSLPPTVREIGHAFEIKSSTVFRMLKALQKKGYLRRTNLGPRSLEVVGQRPSTHSCNCAQVPIIGRVAAGKPILAVEDHTGSITVDEKLLHGGEAFALHVEGDSMTGADILDGDYVIVRKQSTADDGDIVVALIEDEATLKRFYREKNAVRLEPANRRVKPIYVSSGEFEIQGKVVAVQRNM